MKNIFNIILSKFTNSKTVIAKPPRSVSPELSAKLLVHSMDRFNFGGYILNQTTHSYR